MPIVPESRLKGNYGASVLMARLSGQCLVRPVAVDTDVGIDLYCETVAEGRPFLHFWLQVKTGNQCKRYRHGRNASCKFTRKELNYWRRQPIPVFAALVPTDWPAQTWPDVYVVDITTENLSIDFSDARSSFTLKSLYHWPPNDQESVDYFLTRIVPDTTARLQISKGIVAESPTMTPEYVHFIPEVPVLRFKKQIHRQLRLTASNSIYFALRSMLINAEDMDFLRLLALILEQFGDDAHYENYFNRGLVSHYDKNFENAVAMYEMAKSIIRTDENLIREDEFWINKILEIQKLEDLARRHQPFCSAQKDNE